MLTIGQACVEVRVSMFRSKTSSPKRGVGSEIMFLLAKGVWHLRYGRTIRYDTKMN